MSSLQFVTRQVARGLVKHAAMVSPGERAEWTQAMINELDYLSPDRSAVGWALGCISVCYSERIRAMLRPFESLPRWVFVLEMLVCFLPLTLLFSAVAQRGLHGGFTPQAALLYGSATILGPLGLVAALRSSLSKSAEMSRAVIAGLCVLAVWTLAAYSAQIVTFGQSHLSDWWREFVLIAVLPILAVLHLVLFNSHRRDSLVPLSETLR
ncbi:MAG TPA: hypothetical protein VGI32_17835 [Steroidobacteraceae bacterium]